MQLLIKIIMYAVFGMIAGYIMKSKGGFLRNLIMGLIGSVVGGFLASLLPIGGAGNWIVSGAISVAGACLVIWLGRKFLK